MSTKEEIIKLKKVVENLKEEIKLKNNHRDDCPTFSTDSLCKQIIGAPLRPRRLLKGHFGKVYAMHWAGDGHSLVSASQDGKLIVWNGMTTNKEHAIPLKSSWVMTCGFEQSTSTLVGCGGLDNICSVYNVSQPNVTRPSQELSGHDGYLSCCRFNGPSNVLTSSGDCTCIYWDIESTQKIMTFGDHSADVMTVAFSPTDPNIFVSGSCDSSAKIWDLRKNNHQMNFHGHDSDVNSVSFFPSGNGFGTGSDDASCKFYDLRYYGEVNSFSNEKNCTPVTSVSFSSSGRILFAGYEDNTAQAWDTVVASNSCVYTLNAHDQRVSCLGINSKGDALCTGSWDTYLKIWG